MPPDATPSPDLAALAHAAKADSYSPWVFHPADNMEKYDSEWGWGILGTAQPSEGQFAHRAVAEFIAAANPDAVLGLVAEVERLKTLLAKYENYPPYICTTAMNQNSPTPAELQRIAAELEKRLEEQI